MPGCVTVTLSFRDEDIEPMGTVAIGNASSREFIGRVGKMRRFGPANAI